MTVLGGLVVSFERGLWIMDFHSNYNGLWILIATTMAGDDGGAASGGYGGEAHREEARGPLPMQY